MKKQARNRRGQFKGVNRGYTLTKQGYLRYTSGEHRNKFVHRVIVEKRLGRPLEAWEDVHHIDGNKSNNDDSNLEVIDHTLHGYVSAIQRWYVEKVVEPLRKKEWDEYFAGEQRLATGD